MSLKNNDFNSNFTEFQGLSLPEYYKDNYNSDLLDINYTNFTNQIDNIYELFNNSTFDNSDLGFSEFPGLSLPSFDNLKLDNTKIDRDLSQYYDYFNIEQKPSDKKETSKKINVKGPKEFEKVLDEAAKINPEVNKHRKWLTLTAYLESTWQSRPKKSHKAPYEGYFGMGHDLIKKLTGLTVEEYLNNPVQQVLAAVKLYNMNLKTVKAMGIYNKCKEKGYSDDAIIAGTWLGGPGGVKKFINGNGDPSDKHWYGGKGGTTVGTRMKQFNNYA